MKRIFVLSLLLFSLLAIGCDKNSEPAIKNLKIAVIGDSIAKGSHLARLSTELDPLLPSEYEVTNYAVSGTCVVRECFAPIWNTAEFENMQKDEPGTIIVMLGTNDAHSGNAAVRYQFETDYRAMLDVFRAIPSNPRLLLCYPPPLYALAPVNDSIVVHDFIPIIDKIANDYNLEVADTHYKVTDYPENYPDSLHANKAGLETLAKIVAEALDL